MTASPRLQQFVTDPAFGLLAALVSMILSVVTSSVFFEHRSGFGSLDVRITGTAVFLMTSFVAAQLAARRRRRVERLRIFLTGAFLNALDDTPLNPRAEIRND